MTHNYIYCNNPLEYSRLQTRKVKIGDVFIGGRQPISVQSMTTTNTLKTKETVEQSIRMIKAGCELVRITAPSIKEAQNLKEIKSTLVKMGYTTPLVADIHFTPNAAELATKYVEKVRINPGNYADKKKFEVKEYTNESYQEELDRIKRRFLPLIQACKNKHVALRIGSNHGSLSDRIMNRYGDTPLGMVESALEFVRICERENFKEIVLSMKASNPIIMVQAYRLLVHKMFLEDMKYPLHLGVTEAGDGEDGRIKSSVGIGSLLEDGIGDTIRVSLTEEPEDEIPVAKILTQRYNKRVFKKISKQNSSPINPFEYKRRETHNIKNIGNGAAPVVIGSLIKRGLIIPEDFKKHGYLYNKKLDKWEILNEACDYIYVGSNMVKFKLPGSLGIIQDSKVWDNKRAQHHPLFSPKEYFTDIKNKAKINFIFLKNNEITKEIIEATKKDPKAVFLLEEGSSEGVINQREMLYALMEASSKTPVILKRDYKTGGQEEVMLYASSDLGGFLIDGFGDGVFLTSNHNSSFNVKTMFGILQATRTRISKTEYISCPSCGRTLFDLQEVTAKIRAKTNHLKGIKIGIMGCIVNGPGEMADADYGYVGTGKGKITLYKQKEVMKKNVPENEAVDELIRLIKDHNDWVEKT